MNAPDLTFSLSVRSSKYYTSVSLTPFHWRLGYWPMADCGASLFVGPLNLFRARMAPINEAAYEAAKVCA